MFRPKINNNHRLKRAVKNAIIICAQILLYVSIATIAFGHGRYFISVFAATFILCAIIIAAVRLLTKAKIAEEQRIVQFLVGKKK